MKGLKKSKRVTWAQGANLCQVKLFLSKDCPSKVHVEAQCRRRSKTLNANIRIFDKFPAWYVPSRGRQHVDSFKGKRADIPQIKWKCPPEFALDFNWCVAAGEESQEVKVQEDRVTKLLEVVYPRLSVIPPSPSVSLDEEDQCCDDRCTPLIPIIPIEEAEGSAEQPSDAMTSPIFPMNCNPPALSQGPHLAATRNLSQCTMNSQPLSSLGPSTSVDVTITSRPLFMFQGQSISAAGKGPHHTMNSQLPSPSHHPDISTAPSITHCMMKSQLSSLQQHPSTSATTNISQHTIMLQLPSLSLSSTTSATSSISQLPMNAQPVSISQLPSASSSPVIAQCSMNSQPSSLPQAPLTSTNLAVSQCKTTGSQNLPANEKSLMFDGLDGHWVDAVTAAATVMDKCKEEESLIDTDLLIKILRDPKMIGKLMEEHGLAPNTKTKTASGSNPGPSSVSLHSSMPDLSIVKATTEHSETANSRTQAISRSVIAMASKSIEEHGIEAMSIPVSRTRSLPLHNTKPEVLPGKLIEDHVRAYSGIDSKAISRPVIPASFPGSKSEVVHGKVIENHGERHEGASPRTGPKPAVIPVPMPPSKLDTSSMKNFNFSKERGESACPKTEAISRPVTSHQLHSLLSSKAEVVGNKLNEEHGRSHAAPVAHGTKPIAKSASFLLPKPVVSLGKTSVNENKPPIPAGTAHILGEKLVPPLVPSMARPDMEKFKELISEYGAPEGAGQKSLPSGRRDVEMFKKMRNEYGAPDNARHKSLPSRRQKVEMLRKTMNGCGGPDDAGQKSLLSGRQNVEMFKKLLNEYGKPDNTGLNTLPTSEPTCPPFSRTKSEMLVSPRSDLYCMANALYPNLQSEFLSPSHVNTPFSSLTTPPAPPLKDISYLKSLIKQHGEMHESLDDDPHNRLRGPQQVQDLKITERNARYNKPCMYFHSSRGCRNGSSCPYLHDVRSKPSRPGNLLESPGTKRIKLAGKT